MAIIAQAAAEMPDEIVERVIERAMELAEEKGVQLPTWGAMTKLVGQAMTGRLPASSPAAGVDLVIEHCVVDLPVADTLASGAFMPIATVVTTTKDPSIRGLSLSREAPTAGSAARAILEALGNMTITATKNSKLAIYLDTLPGPEWAKLRQVIDRAGIDVVGIDAMDVRPPTATLRLVGRQINRVRMLPRSGRRPFIARPATVPAGASPLELEDAETFLRARWIGTRTAPANVKGAFDVATLQGSLKSLIEKNGV